MKARGQLSAVAALPPVQEPMLPFAQETLWPPLLVCSLELNDGSLVTQPIQ